MSKAKRGPIIVSEEGKTRITLYVDNKIIQHFRTEAEAIGKGYQTLINDALTQVVNSHDSVHSHKTLRRVIREELKSAGYVRAAPR